MFLVYYKIYDGTERCVIYETSEIFESALAYFAKRGIETRTA